MAGLREAHPMGTDRKAERTCWGRGQSEWKAGKAWEEEQKDPPQHAAQAGGRGGGRGCWRGVCERAKAGGGV